QVVPVNTDMDPVTPVQHLADIGLALALRIAEEPEVGNAGVPDLAAARQNARPDAVGDAVETVGKNAAADDLAVPVRVFKQTDAVVLEGQGAYLVSQLALDQGDTVVHGPAGQVVFEPVP